jgi:DNA-binding response OmpR family regulator
MQQLKEKIIVEQKERKNTQQISVVTSRLDYRLKILICEDEEQIGKMYKMALEAAGHRVVLTHNGERCLSEFEHALTDLPFDVVVLDYKLPDMTGDIIANKIFSENPDQRIFFVSAYGNTALTNLGPTGDKINFLTKPVSLVTLVEKIEETEEEDKKHHLSSQIQK